MSRPTTGDRLQPDRPRAEELGRIIRRMQQIQDVIASSGQPASMLEIEELSRLGRQYGEIVQSLEDTCKQTQ